MKCLKKMIQQSFPKVRITNKSIQTEENKLMERRSKLKQQLRDLADYDDAKEILEKEIVQIEEELAKSVSKTNFEKAKETLSAISDEN